MKRKALLLIELLIGMVIIAILAGVTALNTDLWSITAKREAEKIAAKLNSLMLQSDNMKKFFRFTIDKDGKRLIIQWDNEPEFLKPRYTDEEYLYADKGCSFSWRYAHDPTTYSYVKNKFNGGATITVTGKGPTYYVVIAAIGSRVRVTNTDPKEDYTKTEEQPFP